MRKIGRYALVLATAVLSAGAACSAAERIDVYARPIQQERTHDFDVLHYRIQLALDEAEKSIAGETMVRLRAMHDQFDGFVLDAETFVVDSVSNKAGDPLSFERTDGKLAIALRAPRAAGDIVEVTIQYHAVDMDVNGADYGMNASYDLGLDFKAATDTHPQLINTLSFPEGARHWFPSYDHPSDRATQETIVTARSDYEVISNGRLVSVTYNSDNTQKTTHWRQDQNHPTYLFVLVAGPYVGVEDTYGTLPVKHWVYPEAEEIAPIAFASTPDVLKFFEEFYGVDYPWIKYDHITIPGIGGGAESTSANVVGDIIIRDPNSYDEFPSAWLVAHEAAHHWWGNLISYRDWTHMWLSESFATYSEYRYAKYASGDEEGAVNLLRKKDQYLREAREEYMRPIVFDRWEYANDNFDSHGYPKGAAVLHMFESLIGAEKFQRILKTFLTRHAFESVGTEDFIAIAEEVAAEDLDWFFDQWLLSPGHPVFDVSYEWNEARGEIALTVKQTQDTSGRVPVFKTPVSIGVITDAGETLHEIRISQKDETFAFPSADAPKMVRFDVGDVLLKEWVFEKSVEELIYQLRSDNVIGRAWAAGRLAEHHAAPGVRDALLMAMTKDDFWFVRQAAIEAVGAPAPEYYRDLLTKVARTDSDGRVRAAAIATLNGLKDEKTVAFVAKRYERDRSYLVRSAALKVLGASGDTRWKALIEEAANLSSPRNTLQNAANEALESIQAE